MAHVPVEELIDQGSLQTPQERRGIALAEGESPDVPTTGMPAPRLGLPVVALGALGGGLRDMALTDGCPPQAPPKHRTSTPP